MSDATHALTFAAALGCGLLAGVWFAFSAFVMDGLSRLAASEGITAMQSINRTAVTPPLMIALFGTAALCLWTGVWALRSWGDDRAALVLAGSALYLIGTIGVTVAANVPRNDRLALLAPGDPAAATPWEAYVRSWTAWNHVRAATSLAAAALLIAALTQ